MLTSAAANAARARSGSAARLPAQPCGARRRAAQAAHPAALCRCVAVKRRRARQRCSAPRRLGRSRCRSRRRSERAGRGAASRKAQHARRSRHTPLLPVLLQRHPRPYGQARALLRLAGCAACVYTPPGRGKVAQASQPYAAAAAAAERARCRTLRAETTWASARRTWWRTSWRKARLPRLLPRVGSSGGGSRLMRCAQARGRWTLSPRWRLLSRARLRRWRR